jgi:hypothetical protein
MDNRGVKQAGERGNKVVDTSSEYILMCEKAEEIQKDYSIPKAGDFIKCKNGIEIVLDYLYEGDDLKVLITTDTDIGFMRDEFIWLPRQDQLQEMVKEQAAKDFEDGIDMGLGYAADFFDWWLKGNANPFPKSMEQLWLEYLMHLKFNKTWNGKEWVE